MYLFWKDHSHWFRENDQIGLVRIIITKSPWTLTYLDMLTGHNIGYLKMLLTPEVLAGFI